MVIEAGQLDRRVTIQRRTLTRNGKGESIESFADLATIWAQRLDIRAREFFAGQQLQGDVNTRFRIRYRDDVTVLDRLVCEGRTYDIQQVSEIGRREGLEIFCRAFTP